MILGDKCVCELRKMLATSTKVKINSCRVCLETKFKDGVSFDDGDGLLKMYEFCFGLTVSPQDLPRQLCGNCVKKMEDFSKLKLQSHKSDRLWKSIISTRLSCYAKKCSKINIKEDSSDFDYNESIDHYDYNVDEQVNSVITNVVNEVKNELIEEELEQKMEENPNIDIEDELVEHAEDSKCDKKPYECNHCNAVFKFEKHYKKHSCSVTKLKAPTEFCCGLCEMKSFNVEEIKKHLDVHSSNNDLSCKLCEYNGRDFADMVSHRYSHQPKKQWMLNCHSCNKKTVTILALQFHYRSVHLKKKGGLCTVCNKEFGCYSAWRNHERWHKTEGFVCDHCGKRFLFKNQIRAHLEEHSDYKGFVCDICGKTFKRRSHLLLHIGHVHDDKRVTCSHCSKTFKNEATLKDHLRREDRVKPIECKVCSKRYPSKRSLEVHMIWHTDERPFVCHLCGSAYKAKSQLRIHLRKHTGDMPYKCALCTRAFPSSNQLKVHLNVHSGVRPYKCPYCEKTFHNRKNVVDHCSKRHNVFDVVIEGARKAVTKKESVMSDTAVV